MAFFKYLFEIYGAKKCYDNSGGRGSIPLIMTSMPVPSATNIHQDNLFYLLMRIRDEFCNLCIFISAMLAVVELNHLEKEVHVSFIVNYISH